MASPIPLLNVSKNRGIYCIENIITNTVYYGQATNIRRRLNRHKNELSNNKHDNILLQNSWNKYGEAAFSFKEIEIFNDPKINLTPIEKKYFDSTLNKFNLLDPADPTTWTKEMREAAANRVRGIKQSVETVQKRALKLMGNINAAKKEGETRKRRKASIETKQKLSEAQKGNKNALGHKVNEKARMLISQANKGRSPSEKQRRRQSLLMRGNKNSAGRIASLETRKKLAEATKAYWARKKGSLSNE